MHPTSDNPLGFQHGGFDVCPPDDPPRSTARQILTLTARSDRRRLLSAIQRCFYCKKPLTVKEGWLSLCSDLGGGRLAYPCSDLGGGRPVAIFEHTRCGPDVGYTIALSRCSDVSSVYGWLDHVGRKSWCSDVYLNALQQAEEHVKAERILRALKRTTQKRTAQK
jgi:hypothetical protein